MKRPTRWLSAAAVATSVAMTAGLVAAAPAAHAVEVRTAYALVTNQLGQSAIATFDTTAPGTLSQAVPILGLNPVSMEQVLAIDIRPATGVIYGITDDSRLVTISPSTGMATVIGTLPTTAAVTATQIGFDFNPVVDRIRLVSANQNLRIDPTPPAAGQSVNVTADTAPSATGTATPSVSGSAYTNSFAGATGTVLFGIDSGRDRLVTQEPNSGVLTDVGTRLGTDLNVTGINGFDIAAADNTGFAVLQEGVETATSKLFKINLTSGVASAVGSFPAGTIVRGLTLASPGVLGFPDGSADGSTYRVGETGNGITITVTRVGGSEGTVEVPYSTSPGTATAGDDFDTTTGVLSFGPTETSKVFVVGINDDTLVEGAETFTVTLGQPTGGGGRYAPTGAPTSQPTSPTSVKTVTITDSESGTLYGVTTDNRLATFTINAPGAATARTINGLATGERATGLDLRPATGKLYLTTNQGRLFTVDTATATTSPTSTTATLVGTITPAVNGNLFGADFNPVPDRLRLTSDNEQNLRVNPDTPSQSVADGSLRYASGANPSISAVAYTNNVKGATSTQLYGLDDTQDVLVLSDSPNAGTYQTVASTGVNFTGVNGFDISGQGGLALAALIPSDQTTSSLYRVDLDTGRATSLGKIATGAPNAADLTLTGLTFGETGTTGGGGGSNPPAPRGDSAVGRVTLEIGARNNTITAGNRPLIFGIVSDTAAQPRGIANKPVQILQKVYNTNSFTLLETVRTNANGRFELRVNPDRQRAYVARVVGPNGTKQSDQDGQRQDVIFVNNRVNLSAPVGGARVGRSTTVRGDLDPDFGSIAVGVAMLRNNRFTYLTQGTTTGTGAFTINVRNLPVGDYALVVYTSARQGTLAGAASRAVVVR